MTAVAAPPRSADRSGASSLTGTASLARLALRRDRYFLPVWLYVLTAVIASTAYSLRGLYPTEAERAALAAGIRSNPSMTALAGPVYGDSPGALTMWKVGLAAAVGAALMGIFAVIRHTRADEEAGRLELVGSTVLGRQAALAASLVVAFGASLVLALLIAVAAVLLGLPAAGALALGAAMGLTGWVFASVAAVSAQLTGSARAARGIAGGILGLAYLLRTVGDSGSGLSWLTWASPLGWAERLRPFAGERWWVAGLSLAVGAALTGAACLLAGRRDLGAGLLAARPGRARAPGWLRSPPALAWQLQRASLLWWTLGFAATGAVLGASAKGIGSALNSPQARDFITRLGGRSGLIDAYFAALLLMLGVTAAAYGVAAALRPRGEESEQRAELVLATPAGRIRWVAGHLVIAAAGTAVLLGAAGLTAGLAYGLRSGDVGTQLPRLLGAALAQVPAAWLMAGVAVALFGLAPRMAVPAGWTALGVIALLTLVGPTLRLAQWVMDISPFTHVPKLPGGSFTAAPLLWLAGSRAVPRRSGPGWPAPPRSRLIGHVRRDAGQQLFGDCAILTGKRLIRSAGAGIPVGTGGRAQPSKWMVGPGGVRIRSQHLCGRPGWELAVRRTHRGGRAAMVLAAVGIIVVTAVLAACGSTGARPGTPGPSASATPLAQAGSSGPPSSPRANALALARQLLSRLILPPGARPGHVSPLPQSLRQPSSLIIGSVDVHRLFMLRQPLPAAGRFLLAHVPAGMRRFSNGQASGPAGVTTQHVSFAPRSVPSGVDEAGLIVTVVPGSGGGSVLRADAQVSWFPLRTAAEHLDPASFHVVTISATRFNPRLHTVTRVFTSQAVIARLAGLMNGLPAAPDRSVSCPMTAATYRLDFAARAGSPPDVVATADGCLTDRISVNGKAQPVLWDRTQKLATAASQLLTGKPRL